MASTKAVDHETATKTGDESQVLVDALNTLTVAPGDSPDAIHRKRKLAIGALFLQLTDSEIFDLRARLNAVKLWRFPENLPLELHWHIWKYLDLEDLMNLRLVRLRWHKTFSDVVFCEQIVKQHLPWRYSRYEIEYKAFESNREEQNLGEKQTLAKMALKSWLENFMKRRYQRACGRYHSTSIYRHKRLGGLPMDDEPPHNPQYCNGRVAFQRGPSMLVVKSLYSDSEKAFAFENRRPFAQWLLSDRYIVAVTIYPATVWAWPLDLIDVPERDNLRSIRLPNRVQTISARGEYVGIITSINEVYLWNIGQFKDIGISQHAWLEASKNQLRNVEVSMTPENMGPSRLKQIIVVFHPLDQNRFFVCSEHHLEDPPNNKTRFTFQEFEKVESMGKYTCDLNFPGNQTQIAQVAIGAMHDNTIGICNISGYSQHNDGTEFGPIGNSVDEGEMAILTFDMDTKAIRCQNYKEPDIGMSATRSRIRADEGRFIWRNQTLLPVYMPDLKAGDSTQAGITDILVTAVNHASGRPAIGPPCTMTCYGIDSRSPATRVNLPGSESPFQSPTAYNFIGDPDFGSATWLPVDNQNEISSDLGFGDDALRKVRGDDDFVVLFGGFGFMVWCFDENVRLRVKDSVEG